jgi:hypothetical protein
MPPPTSISVRLRPPPCCAPPLAGGLPLPPAALASAGAGAAAPALPAGCLPVSEPFLRSSGEDSCEGPPLGLKLTVKWMVPLGERACLNSWLSLPSRTLRATTHSPILSSVWESISRTLPLSLSITVTESFPLANSAALTRSLITMVSSQRGATVFCLLLERTSGSMPNLKMTYGSLEPFRSLALSPVAECNLTDSWPSLLPPPEPPAAAAPCGGEVGPRAAAGAPPMPPGGAPGRALTGPTGERPPAAGLAGRAGGIVDWHSRYLRLLCPQPKFRNADQDNAFGRLRTEV